MKDNEVIRRVDNLEKRVANLEKKISLTAFSDKSKVDKSKDLRFKSKK